MVEISARICQLKHVETIYDKLKTSGAQYVAAGSRMLSGLSLASKCSHQTNTEQLKALVSVTLNFKRLLYIAFDTVSFSLAM